MPVIDKKFVAEIGMKLGDPIEIFYETGEKELGYFHGLFRGCYLMIENANVCKPIFEPINKIKKLSYEK
jgi:hypothetical protein